MHFICVGTPQRKGEYAADLRYVDAVVDGAGPAPGPADASSSASRRCRSAPPRGCSAGIAELAPAGDGVELAWNPEFLREGFAVEDTLRPDRLVFGVALRAAPRQLLREVYATRDRRRAPRSWSPTSPPPSWSRSAANAFLATKISFINAMAEVCEATGADVTQLADAIGYDDRIGRKFLHAGLGFGGGCLPKDIRAFMARAGELGVDQALTFLHEVDAINMRRRGHVVDLAREAVGGSFLGMRVAVLGAAFKPNTDDVRDSPALDVAGQIQLQGAQVTVYDPRGMDNARRCSRPWATPTPPLEAASGADVVLHLTEWQEFREMDPAVLAAVVVAAEDRRRPQRPRPGALARRRLDLPRARPPVTEQDTIRRGPRPADLGGRRPARQPGPRGVRRGAVPAAPGKRIVPVHHQPQDVFGETAYPRLADIPYPVDVVDVFVNSAWPATSPTRPSRSARRPSGSSSGSSTRRPPSGSAPPGC